MGVEYINRISFKKDGVYLSTKSNNDDRPYRSVKIDTLSELYLNEGKESVEVELAHMFLDYCEPRGNHKSVEKYRTVLYSSAFTEYNQDFCEKRTEIYDDFRKAHPAYDMRKGLTGEWKDRMNSLYRQRDEKIKELFSEYDRKHSREIER